MSAARAALQLRETDQSLYMKQLQPPCGHMVSLKISGMHCHCCIELALTLYVTLVARMTHQPPVLCTQVPATFWAAAFLLLPENANVRERLLDGLPERGTGMVLQVLPASACVAVACTLAMTSSLRHGTQQLLGRVCSWQLQRCSCTIHRWLHQASLYWWFNPANGPFSTSAAR